MFKHPVAIILLIVSIVIIINMVCEERKDSENNKTRQLELQLKLEEVKQFGTTNVTESIINKK